MRRRISSTMLVEMLPDFSRSKASNAFFSTATLQRSHVYEMLQQFTGNSLDTYVDNVEYPGGIMR
jgi:hypothetical protein